MTPLPQLPQTKLHLCAVMVLTCEKHFSRGHYKSINGEQQHLNVFYRQQLRNLQSYISLASSHQDREFSRTDYFCLYIFSAKFANEQVFLGSLCSMYHCLGTVIYIL